MIPMPVNSKRPWMLIIKPFLERKGLRPLLKYLPFVKRLVVSESLKSNVKPMEKKMTTIKLDLYQRVVLKSKG